ncbi:hypothetical protein [Micromonospora sp. NPDC005205]|uniref:hypothetical protein n=1 Tax=Micromonospora sp. NPDC005205 TaxID=3156714 RepID=UPI0033B7C2BD
MGGFQDWDGIRAELHDGDNDALDGSTPSRPPAAPEPAGRLTWFMALANWRTCAVSVSVSG